MAKAQWAMANRRRSRYGYPVSPMTGCFFCNCLYFGVVSGFLVLCVFHGGGTSILIAFERTATLGATFTFQLIKAVSDETELGYDGDRSACFR